MRKIKKIIGIFSIFALSFTFTLPAFAQVEAEENPTIGEACGLDIAMLLDMTGSIDTGGATQTVKDAAKDFVNAFLPDTPTLIGLVEFSEGTASEVQDLTGDESDLESDIDGLSPGGATNWEEAILLGTAMLEGSSDRDDTEHADLMIVITDGNPNEPGTDEEALDAAIEAANLAKTSSASEPIRIVAVGVGDANEDNLVAISGPNVNGTITKDTDVITGDYEDLADILGNLAAALCENPDPDCTECPHNEFNFVHNSNYAFVSNDVEVSARTGRNYAGGSYGGDGGDGGDIKNYGDGDVASSTTGNGANGGNSGIGGTVITGHATSTATLDNRVNHNRTEIELCPCDGAECCECAEGECDETWQLSVIHNRNLATVFNRARADADTGINGASGSYAGDGGEGGDIKNTGDGDVEESATGNGASGGSSSDGGLVQTGRSESRSHVLNLVNYNISRIFR